MPRPKDTQVVLAGSSALKPIAEDPLTATNRPAVSRKGRKETESTADGNSSKQDRRGLERGKGLALISSLNTVGPVPVAERMPPMNKRYKHVAKAECDKQSNHSFASTDKVSA